MKFTVVTPSYGQLDWLELCLASVADQSVAGGVEHLVCDGGSPGIEEFRTQALQRFASSKSYRLVFHVENDAGMYDAINKGLRRAEGDVCSYLNCDEQLLPGALSAVNGRLAAQPDLDVLFGDAIVVDADGEGLCYWRPYVPSLRHLAGATLNTLSCSTFFRRRVVEDGHLFDPQWKAVGDLVWVRGLLEKKRSMACLPQPLAAFTFLGDNLGASPRAEEEFRASRKARGGWLGGVRRAWHAVRKFSSGAYVHRRVTYDLFALSDPTRRRRYTSARLGWTWPHQPATRP
jgi:glycosyltransferase involved in cell wall biosynthesis